MSVECAECERDLRSGHHHLCSRYTPPPKCSKCEVYMHDDGVMFFCPTHGYDVEIMEDKV